MGTENKVVLITGASSGIGKACAEHLHRLGYRVYGTTRREPGELPACAHTMIRMDVDDDDSVTQGIDLILANEGRLDVIVNNAGIGISGAVEDTSLDEAKAQFETNFFGVLRVCRQVLPVMRAQGSGHIINISSVAGLVGVPFNGLYCATKFALEGLSETLRMEVKPHGIHVSLVEPGDINTAMSAHSLETRESASNPAYRANHTAALSVMARDEAEGPQPLVVAELIATIIRAPSPRLHYQVGSFIEKMAVTMKTLLPARLFEWGLMQYYRVR